MELKISSKKDRLVDDYIAFQKKCLSPFQVAAVIEKKLTTAGYKKLPLD